MESTFDCPVQVSQKASLDHLEPQLSPRIKFKQYYQSNKSIIAVLVTMSMIFLVGLALALLISSTVHNHKVQESQQLTNKVNSKASQTVQFQLSLNQANEAVRVRSIQITQLGKLGLSMPIPQFSTLLDSTQLIQILAHFQINAKGRWGMTIRGQDALWNWLCTNCQATLCNLSRSLAKAKFYQVVDFLKLTSLGSNWSVSPFPSKFNISNSKCQSDLRTFYLSIFRRNFAFDFGLIVFDQGNKLYEDSQIQAAWERVVFVINRHPQVKTMAPGITDQASTKWFDMLYKGRMSTTIFTLQAVLYPSSKGRITYDDLLTDNQYVKNYLKNRFTSNTHPNLIVDLHNFKLSFNYVRLTDTKDDSIYDSFAVCSTVIEFVLQSILLGINEVVWDFEAAIRVTNSTEFQLRPTAYALLLLQHFLRDNSLPQSEVTPNYTLSALNAFGGPASCLAYQLILQDSMRILLISKSLTTDPIKITLIPESRGDVFKCFSMKAPSLAAGRDQVTIDGQKFYTNGTLQRNQGGQAGQGDQGIMRLQVTNNVVELELPYASIISCEAKRSITNIDLVEVVEPIDFKWGIKKKQLH